MPGLFPFLTPLRVLLACAYRAGFCVLRFTRYRSRTPLKKSRLVVVGSHLAGGAGKTPLVQKMAEELLLQGKSVAILCHSAAWDEFRMLQSKVRGAAVLKTSDRFRTAKDLDGKFDIILCDGGLEDTRFVDADVFVLRWNERAKSLRDLIPWGSCVSLEKDHPEALTVTCSRSGGESSSFAASFTLDRIVNYRGEALSRGTFAKIVTGIGNPERLAKDVTDGGISVKQKVFLRDHSKSYAKRLRQELSEKLPIVLTEKDLFRLDDREKENPLLYVAKERVQINSTFENYLKALAGGAARNPPSTL